MKSVAWWILSIGALLSLAALLHSSVLRDASAADSQAAKPLPPLKVDKSAPLLLLSKPAPQPPADAAPVADNSACFCCHGNYREEPLATVHAKAKIGCVDCHGPSLAHRGDEGNITPPDKMYWPERIGPMCQECHKTHDVPAQKVVVRWRERCPTKQNPDKIVCTDCHGHHRLPSRTVLWDKKTGKPLPHAAPQAEKATKGS